LWKCLSDGGATKSFERGTLKNSLELPPNHLPILSLFFDHKQSQKSFFDIFLVSFEDNFKKLEVDKKEMQKICLEFV
jgi:hypothetical protein